MAYDVKVVSINDVDSMVMKDDVQVGQGTDDGNDKETNDGSDKGTDDCSDKK